MNPREIHRITSGVRSEAVVEGDGGDGLSNLCGQVMERFAHFSPARVMVVPWHAEGMGPSAAIPVHPECVEFAGSLDCREAWELQRTALERHAEPVWQHCPYGRLCGLVPVVCRGQCRAAFKVVTRDGHAQEPFTRALELLEILTEHALGVTAPTGFAAQATKEPAGLKMETLPHVQVERALAYIDERLSDPNLSVATVAEAVGSHPDYLAHLFCADTGERMGHYITLQRVALGRRLLASTAWQIKRVAWACGYANPSWFSHIFRDHTGTTPVAFRKAARLGP